MKLEFESNAVSSPLVGNNMPAELADDSSAPEVLDMLRAGIKSAQDGDRAEARNLLLRVTEADPRNENAWLWLASISEYPEELLVFLNNVLQINPNNERALDWAKATKSLIAKTFVQRGIDAAKDGQKQFAKQCFLQAIVHDSESELAYLWLASVADSAEEKMSHLQKVLSLNPENENALTSLRNAKEQKAKALLPKANTAAISGKREKANKLLAKIFEDAPEFEDAWMLKAHISDSFDAKIEAFERVLSINPENPVARANVDSLRMFAGNSELDDDAPVQSDDFQDSREIFTDSRQDTGVDAQDDTVSFDAQEMEAEARSVEAIEDDPEDVEYHEEETVAFDVVAPSDEKPADEPHAEESDLLGENFFDFKEDEPETEAVQEDQSPAAYLTEQESPAEQPVEFDDVEFEAAADKVDHDYDAEAVDFVADDEDSQEPVEFDLSSVDASDAAESDESESVEEEADDPELHADASSEEELETDSEEDEASFASFDADSDEQAMDADSRDSDEPEMPSFETAENLSPELPSDEDAKFRSCPYCSESNENQAFACQSCKAIFTISDIEMILSHNKANKEIISKALGDMEVDKSLRGVDVEELKFLGIGYLNLKDYRKGFEYLQDAAKKDPSDVILVSQIDALAVRLAEIEDHERAKQPNTASKKILVVDDSPTVRKLISGKLEKCGHEPICAVDGMDALAKINEEIPDLILLDITMPRMDGYQVCKLIRSNDATKDVPVVMISGKDGFFDKVRGRMAGTSNYITKPFGPETLMKTVNEYIQ